MKAFFSTRTQLIFILLGSLILLTGVFAYLFAQIWVDQGKAYGLSGVRQRLDLLIIAKSGVDPNYDPSKILGSKDWFVELPNFLENPNAEPKIFPAGALNKGEVQSILKQVEKTHVTEGSFEITKINKSTLQESTLFIVFKRTAKGTYVAGTPQDQDLMILSVWAMPFAGSFSLVWLAFAIWIILITRALTRHYGTLSKVMENIGAGRLERLQFPTSSDPDIKNLSNSMQTMVKTLYEKDKRISEIAKIADEDPMTEMPNYRAFTNYIALLLGIKEKRPGIDILTIIDLDFFKKINDNYGHQSGDYVLRHVSAIIKKHVRVKGRNEVPSDFCGRYGGEEFVAVFANCDPAQFHIPALRICRAIKETPVILPANVNEQGVEIKLNISASIGLARWDPEKYTEKENWIQMADTALYEAKHRGRARLVTLDGGLKEFT